MFVLYLLYKDSSIEHKWHEEGRKDLKVQNRIKKKKDRKNPCEGEIFRADGLWGPPNLLYNGYRVIPGEERAGRGVNHPPHLAQRLKEE